MHTNKHDTKYFFYPVIQELPTDCDQRCFVVIRSPHAVIKHSKIQPFLHMRGETR